MATTELNLFKSVHQFLYSVVYDRYRMTQTGQSPQLVAGISFPINELWYRGKQRVAPKIYYGLMVVVGRSRVLRMIRQLRMCKVFVSTNKVMMS